MLQTLKHILGEELFFKALSSYIETLKDKIADTAGFIIAFWEKYPGNVYISHEVAHFYFAQENWEKGIEFYQKILILGSHDFTFVALANIAGAYEMMDDQKMQKLYLEKALSRWSSMYSLMRRLGMCWKELKNRLDSVNLHAGN